MKSRARRGPSALILCNNCGVGRERWGPLKAWKNLEVFPGTEGLGAFSWPGRVFFNPGVSLDLDVFVESQLWGSRNSQNEDG